TSNEGRLDTSRSSRSSAGLQACRRPPMKHGVLALLIAVATHVAFAADVTITPILHSSVQIEHDGFVIQVDPWSRADLSRAKPADLILVTDDPIHHLDPKAIAQLRKPVGTVIVPAASQAKFPDGTAMANG